MTLQDVTPTQKLVATNKRVANRIPQILEMEIQGQNQTQIAENLGVSRMQIWRDKQTDLYTYFVNNWIERYEESLDNMLKNGTPQYQNEATKEIGRMIRGTKTKQIETKSTNLHLRLQEIRSANAWVGHLTPTEFDQFHNMRDTALKRMNNPKT